MKKKLLLAVVFIVMIALSAYRLLDIYEELQITKEEAKERLIESIAFGVLVRGNQENLVSNARNMPVETRVTAIRELIQLAKEYSTSDDFAKKYKAWRKERLNPGEKTKLGLPKLGKIIDNKVNNKLDKAENEKKYPAEPKDLIKNRLTEFLELSATVDFDAELVNNQFANPNYVKKNVQWKMCFRAGKEVVEAAREEAKKWLDELNGN